MYTHTHIHTPSCSATIQKLLNKSKWRNAVLEKVMTKCHDCLHLLIHTIISIIFLMHAPVQVTSKGSDNVKILLKRWTFEWAKDNRSCQLTHWLTSPLLFSFTALKNIVFHPYLNIDTNQRSSPWQMWMLCYPEVDFVTIFFDNKAILYCFQFYA